MARLIPALVPAISPQASFNPASTSAAYEAMRERIWELDAVWGGTQTLRDAGVKLLPQYERESDPDYKSRLSAARLMRNMFRQSVERTAGRIFEVPVKLNPTPAEGSAAWTLNDNADLMNNSLDRVLRNYAVGALRRGMSHILVDYPKTNFANLAQERAAAPRPYLVALHPSQILESYEDELGATTYVRWYARTLGWDREASAVVMTERIQERFADGTSPAGYRVWEQVSEAVRTGSTMIVGQARKTWTVVAEGTITQPRIMLHTLYAEQEEYMVGRTPLTEVKDLTLEVWEVGSDLKNCIQQVLFPLFFATGIALKESGNVVLGPKSILGSENHQAKFGYAEHTGAAIKSGEEYIRGLEQRAEAYAGQLTRPTGDVKATQTALSSAEVSSWVRDFALSLQDKAQAIVDDCTAWQSQIASPRVVVNLDFSVDLPDGDLTELGSARRAGDISRSNYTTELQRRNVLRADFNAEENDAELEEETAASMQREKDMMQATAAIEAPREPAEPTGEEE